MRTIGENIKEERLRQNLTQYYMATKLGISQNAFSKIELGYTDPNITRIREIAKLFDMEVIELIKEQ